MSPASPATASTPSSASACAPAPLSATAPSRGHQPVSPPGLPREGRGGGSGDAGEDAHGPDGHRRSEPCSHLAQGGLSHLYRAENCSGEKQRALGAQLPARHSFKVSVQGQGEKFSDIHYIDGPRTSTRGGVAARESQKEQE